MAEFVLSAFADEAADSLSGQIEALLENGIGYIEPRNIDGTPILRHTNARLREIKYALDSSGIKVGSLGSPIGKYPITEPMSPHLDEFKRALEVCHILGTSNMRMFSFFVDRSELALYRNEVLERMSILLELARDAEIRLCHENESGIYGCMPDEVSDLISSLPSLYAIFDPANYRMNGADINEGLRATLIRPAYMHIKDAIFETQEIVPAGEGEGKVSEAINAFDTSIEGEVMLTLEPHLHVFSAYKSIDRHELRGKYKFDTSRAAFDFASGALKKILLDNGYKRSCNGIWKR